MMAKLLQGGHAAAVAYLSTLSLCCGKRLQPGCWQAVADPSASWGRPPQGNSSLAGAFLQPRPRSRGHALPNAPYLTQHPPACPCAQCRLLKREHLDLRITPYQVLPTSSSDGLIQFVPSVPLARLLADHRSIHRFLAMHHPDPKGKPGAANRPARAVQPAPAPARGLLPACCMFAGWNN
jgi:hypothetical protein